MTISVKQHTRLIVWTLAIAAIVTSPITVSAASNTANTIINATVDSVISITTSTSVAIGVTPTAGGAVSSASDTVTVNTNHPSGYNLTLADTDGNTDLTSGSDAFSASAGTQGSPVALANDTWGYRVDGVGGFGSGPTSVETNNGSSTTIWAGVPASGSPVTLKTTATPATNDVTTVWYGVKATASQPNGTYSDTVTYTATTN